MSELNFNGQVLSNFTDVQLPLHLSLDSEDRVLVPDERTHRVLLLNSQLQLRRVVVDNTTSQGQLWYPWRLCYNEVTSQLYVAHGTRERSAHDVVSLFHVR